MTALTAALITGFIVIFLSGCVLLAGYCWGHKAGHEEGMAEGGRKASRQIRPRTLSTSTVIEKLSI